jgi:predicted esterase
VINELSIETPTHGRVLVQDAADSVSHGLIVACHGYGQAAEDMLSAVSQIPGASRWRIAAVQALHRFYTRGDEKVVASWMTRQDRDVMIADNIEYVDRAIDRIHEADRIVHTGKAEQPRNGPTVIAGFSQGTAMAYRVAMLGRHVVTGVIALGGDIPSEIKQLSPTRSWPAVLIGAGDTDWWYTAEKVQADEEFLESRGATLAVTRFGGGHEWAEEFRLAAGVWLARLASGT